MLGYKITWRQVWVRLHSGGETQGAQPLVMSTTTITMLVSWRIPCDALFCILMLLMLSLKC